MGGSASKTTAPKISAQDRAILDLKLQRDRIQQYQRKLQYVSDREWEAARMFLSRNDKSRALTALRKRKYQEGLLDKTDKQLETLGSLVSSIEFSQIQLSVVHGLQQGNTVLKEIHREMNTEAVEKLMEETAEAQAYQQEIDEMLSSRMTAQEEEAVHDELAVLEREALKKDVGSTNVGTVSGEPTVELPSAPSAEPIATQTPSSNIDKPSVIASDGQQQGARELIQHEDKLVPA